MNRTITRVCTILLAASAGLAGFAGARDAERPNVLFIAVDDLRTDLGTYGHPTAVTPNMDALGASGLVFERAYTQQAVCAPSRAALMTGLRPETTGIDSLHEPISETVPDAVTVAKLFKQSGYETMLVGKLYHHHDDDPDAWSTEPFSTMKDARKARRKSGEKLSRLAVPDEEAGDLPDMQSLAYATDALRRFAAEDEPFFMAFGIYKPHLPFYAPQSAWNLYDEADVPEPVSRTKQDGAPDRAVVAYEVWNYDDTPKKRRKNQPQSGMPESDADALRHGYLAAVSYADTVVGKLLAELERLELADDTIVVLWSDHGYKLGDHGGWAKHSTVELDIHIPMMIRVPGRTTPGSRSPALVETVDLYPTLAELAGLEAPQTDGLSLTPLLTDPDRAWKEAAFSRYPRGNGEKAIIGETVQTDRYRYTAWVRERDGEVVDTELYDHRADPNELVNVAGRADLAAVVTAHEEIRRAGWQDVRAAVEAGDVRFPALID